MNFGGAMGVGSCEGRDGANITTLVRSIAVHGNSEDSMC